MLASLRRSYAELVTSGAQFILWFVGIHIKSSLGWYLSLGTISRISFLPGCPP